MGQEKNFKKQAITTFKNGDFTKAIELLEQAKNENPNDSEIYYYLGYFSHYLAYDSRPLVEYDVNYSDKILQYLNKAIELNPDFGNAYYFIGAEYGARATKALQNNEIENYKLAYKLAYEKGAFPAWLIEYGNNILKSCDKNAILFVGGDAEFNPIQYLQIIENYRKDVTLIPIAFINRPWYVKKLKEGFGNILTKVPINFSNAQILDMHPYKWDTLSIKISISEKMQKTLKLLPNKKMKWEIEPDLKSERRTYLSVDRAVLVNIIETNQWERPIYFSLGINTLHLAGLNEYFQLVGLVNKLLPIKTENTKYKISPLLIEKILLNSENIKDFKDVNLHNMPRVSNILLNYYAVLFKLATYYKDQNQSIKINKIVNYIKKNMMTNILPQGEKIIKTISELSKDN